MQKEDNSGEAANYGLLLTNILLANILAMECMIRMWWTGNLAVLRSYMKWAEQEGAMSRKTIGILFAARQFRAEKAALSPGHFLVWR